ncbi:MAG: cytochrome C assembly protein [Candidatus Dadabacteria bacterium]|nr:MAG: cytochrome C assembly protein [Candidatus Dadabacteria bacterium]
MTDSTLFTKTSKLANAVFLLAFILISYANYMIFMVVPNEKIMGPVQRIFYFHVGSAIACYCSFAIVLTASIVYLFTDYKKADLFGRAGAEVGFVFCTIVLLSGMIWGKAAWNTWFRWEPRLVSFLLLWLIALALNVIRIFGDSKNTARHAAVLGIIGAVTVPIVVFSIKLLPAVAQLHPEVVAKRGLKHPDFIKAMFIAMGGLVLFQFYLIWLRAKIAFLEEQQ